MYVYVLRNGVNGKCYVGQTIQEPNKRFNQHRHHANYEENGMIVSRAIEKYGWCNFEKYILQVCERQDDLDNAERYWIERYNSLAPNGYNIDRGGNGRGSRHKLTEEHKTAISKGSTHHKPSAEHKAAISAAQVGRKRTPKEIAIVTMTRPQVKLSFAIAAEIRTKRSAGSTLKELAAEYCVSIATISMICNRRIWNTDYCALLHPIHA